MSNRKSGLNVNVVLCVQSESPKLLLVSIYVFYDFLTWIHEKKCRNNEHLLFALIFWFFALLTISRSIICYMHEIDFLLLLYWSLVCFHQCFKLNECRINAYSALNLQQRAYFQVVWRLSDFDVKFLFALIWEQYFAWIMSSVLQLMVLNYFRAGMIQTVWLPSYFTGNFRFSSEFHSIQTTITNLSFLYALTHFIVFRTFYVFHHDVCVMICARTRACHREANSGRTPTSLSGTNEVCFTLPPTSIFEPSAAARYQLPLPARRH
jgi:hypothetical protein